ncbi:WD repeat-containing protein 75-like [Patiria miniata]|uniref:WD repeat-containing protein 75 second beta-propeller domain-containing protein n=1 Tax=Patiria miniata TaxID=46514 RepID=A0A914BT61_PATMI|nr:WD repeat-containing protein 75-like [Patiria miniata]
MAALSAGRVVVRGGADLVKNRPVFSSDSKYVFVASGYTVKVFNVASGDCVRQLRGHDGEVTGVVVNPQNKLQVFTSSTDGTINQWDYMDSVLLKTLYVRSPIHGLFAHPAIPDYLFATTFDEKSDKKSRLKLVKIAIPKMAGTCVDVQDKFLLGNVLAGDKGIAFGVGGEFIATVKGNTLKILFMEDLSLKKLSPDKTPLTCVACHPVDYCIAVGDEKGRISIWRNFHKKERRALEHWHSLRVEDLCYSPEGSVLYSVGHECTLVEWQHESLQKKFLPRQGAPINHVTCSPNSQQRALSLMTNAILIQSHQKTTQTVQGLVHTNFNRRREGYLPTGLVIDPHTRALVTNGMVGQLQFYQLEEDRLLFSLDITGENYISPADLGHPLMHTEVEKVTFDLRGEWMATVERRDDKQTSPEMRLKFWQFDKLKQSFVLNTVISEPHTGRISCLSFRPSSSSVSHDMYEPMAVTAGDDGKFKLWALANDDDSHSKNRSWGCDSVGFFREDMPRCACFSSDGSLLVVAFGHVVTIWDPDVNVLKKTLCHGTKDHLIEHMAFGHGSASHCLVSASSSVLNVWSLLTCSVIWRVNMKVSVLAADTESEFVAVFDKSGNLFVFHPLEPKLVYSKQDLPTPHIISAVFIPKTREDTSAARRSDLLPWETHSHLYFVTKCLMLATVTSQVDQQRANRADLEERLPPTPFAMLLNNQQRKVDKEGEGVRMQDLPASANMREMLQSPAHILPPVKSLCATFLQGLLNPGAKALQRRDEVDTDESDAESDKESDSEESDMETETAVRGHMTQSKDTGNSTDQSEHHVRSGDQYANEALSEADYRRLEKVSRSGLKWMRKVFQETY